MEVLFHNKGPNGGIKDNDTNVVFTAIQPVIIQPGEIKKVPTGASLRVPTGNIALLTTPESLYMRALEIFPAVLVIDHTTPAKPLEIPIRNSGRNQINLKEDEVIAIGHLLSVQEWHLSTFDPKLDEDARVSKTQPQRKNSDITFEIR